MYNSLQLREVFHLEFLRWLGRKVKAEHYAVKGGTNLRLFFKSFRYSEDMDLDIKSIKVGSLKDIVLDILKSQSFLNSLKAFGIEEVLPPDMTKAKQTETTQRFKVHLMTFAGEDLYTKVEFSCRGFSGNVIVQAVYEGVLRTYKLAPLLVPHYDIESTIAQKIRALAKRPIIQGRDIFDIYVLSPQCQPDKIKEEKALLKKAHDNIFEIDFEQFRDTVISYLSAEDQFSYNSSASWDEIKLKAANFIDEAGRKYGKA